MLRVARSRARPSSAGDDFVDGGGGAAAVHCVRRGRQRAAARRCSASRVVVFPELSLTGYELDAPAVAPDEAALAPIVGACAKSGAVALVGAPVQDRDGQVFIAVLQVDAAGVRVEYRKTWLGTCRAYTR